MNKFKKYFWQMGLLGAALSSLAVSVIACSNNEPATKQFTFKKEIKIVTDSKVTLKVKSENLDGSELSADQNAVNDLLNTAANLVKPTVKAASKSKKTNELTKEDFQLSPASNLAEGVKQEIGLVTFDSFFNTVANVQVKFTKGSASSFYVVQIPGFTKPDDNFGNKKAFFLAGDPLNPRWIDATKKADQIIKNFGFSGKSENKGKTDEQLNAFDSNKDSDILVLSPFESGGLNNKISEATKAGKAIVDYDRLVTGTKEILFYTTYDNFATGRSQGFALASALVGSDQIFDSIDKLKDFMKGKTFDDTLYLQLAGDPGDNNSKLFYGGAESVLKVVRDNSGGKIKAIGGSEFSAVAIPGWKNDEAAKRITTQINTITNKDQIKGVLSPNDGFAIASVNSLTSAGLDATKIFITGQDAIENALPLIEDKKINHTISKPDNILLGVALSMGDWLARNATTEEKLKAIRGSDQLKEMIEFVRVKNPNAPFRVDLKTYTNGTTGDANYAPVTFILNPVVITSKTFSDFYEAKK